MIFTEEMILDKLAGYDSCKSSQAFVYDVIDSTNLEAKRLIADGLAVHGSLVAANSQTAGRGRLGRSFYSPADGLYMSIIVKADFDLSHIGLVTVGAAAAVSEAIDMTCRCRTQIKWVNDIYMTPACGCEPLKVSGILTEANTDRNGNIDYLIIGIGINTSNSSFPENLRGIAGSISSEKLNDRAKAALAAKVTAGVIRNCGEISSMDSVSIAAGNAPLFLEYYKEKSLLLGQDIFVYKGSYRQDPAVELGGIPARAIDIADDGGLVVEYADGSRETLTTGEVSVRKAL